jgi:hypothetical protein
VAGGRAGGGEVGRREGRDGREEGRGGGAWGREGIAGDKSAGEDGRAEAEIQEEEEEEAEEEEEEEEELTNNLLEFLTMAKLANREPRLRAEGYEEVDDLVDADDHDLVKCGLKKPEIRRLRRYLEG